MPFCTVHDPALIARLTGFLVVVPMASMAPTTVWVKIGASRINELIGIIEWSRSQRPGGLKSLTTSPTGVSSGHFRSRYASV